MTMPDVELRTEAEYEAALAEIDRLLDLEPEKGTPEHDALQHLRGLVEAYDLRQMRARDADDLPVENPREG
jgi:antitoxin component HigA of HigAB toxin-antitoxin module